MAYPKLTMRKIREVLRLNFEGGFNHREIARALGASYLSAEPVLTVWRG